jgi:hypothetical protein
MIACEVAMKADGVTDQVMTILRGFSTLEWVLLAIGLVVVLVAAFLWWRHKRRTAKPDAAATAAAPAKPSVSLAKQLIDDARAFRRGLPAPARRSLDSFHPIVVLGTESSGKAAIVERFAGVAQRRVELGPRAEHAGAQLRCQLGADVIVFDPSEDVVRAPRELVGGGLARALGSALRRRAPIVVVCISPEALDKQSEPQLAELGSALRAKLDVLSALRDEPVAVRVVISDVPGFARFDALFRLLHLPGIPSVLSIDRVDDDAVCGALLAYADEIGNALTQLSPSETLELVGFLEALPHLSSALSVLLGELFANAGELTPRPDGLYLLPTDGGPNPLVIPETMVRPGASPLLKHRLIALSVATAAGGVLYAGFRSDAASWDRASAAASSYELQAEGELDLRLTIRGYTGGASGGLTDRLTPRFFVDGPAAVACRFAEQVREDFLLGSLNSALSPPPEQRAPERALYAGALLYATSDNELGHLVADRIDQFAIAVGLEPSLLGDYLRMARPYKDQRALVRLRDAGQAVTADGVSDRFARFLALLAPDRAWTASDIALTQDLARKLRPELDQLAPFGASQRILGTPPFDRLASAFKAHATRFDLLAQLWDNRAALDKFLERALESIAPEREVSLRSFSELAGALDPLFAVAGTAAASTLVIANRAYEIDAAGFLRAVRGGEIERIVAAFSNGIAGAGARALLPDEAAWKEVPLGIVWPTDTTGATDQVRAYTRELFEGDVKRAVFTTHQLLDRLDKLGGHAQTKAQIEQLLGSALEAYALGYEQELERIITSFRADLSSEVAAQRVLRALSGTRSPLRALVASVAHNAELGLVGDKTGFFDPMIAVEEHFGTLPGLLTAGKAGDAFVAYQDVLRTLGASLAAPAPAGKTPAEAGPGSSSAAITSRLSPAGALAFAVVTGATDTPLAALDAWLADKALTDEVVDVFRAPVRAVYRLGVRDVEGALGAWDRDVQTSADADLFSRFPFDRHAGDDLDPQTLSVWLAPKRGRLAGELLPALAGLVIQTRGWDGHARHRAANPCSGDEVCVRVPPALLATLDRLAATSELLWDDTGKPRPLEVAVTPRPFTLAAGDGPLPELVRLSVGESSVFYFNQRPRRTTLALDWTKDHTATLTVQIKQDGSLSLTPPAIAAAGSPWAFFHLLQQAERRGSTYTWRVPIAPTQVLSVSYDVTDPTAHILGTSKALVSRGPR